MSAQKQKILLVDDEKDLVELLSIRLEEAGFEVITSLDGHEGLEKAKREKPDLIILDIMMPKMDGYQFCRLLKFDRQFEKIPILMLTARTQEQDRKTGLTVGADAYITKPYSLPELLNKIRSLLKGELT